MPNPNNTNGLRQASCAPACGFLVRSADENEVVRATRAHVKEFHGVDLDEAQARASVADAR